MIATDSQSACHGCRTRLSDWKNLKRKLADPGGRSGSEIALRRIVEVLEPEVAKLVAGVDAVKAAIEETQRQMYLS